ncbi:uncharacterized protein IL334_002634 [Kwoniella shivajii]|uniref:Uncharacterized protein n=1 Tax=Kwoniella shivajii TaxID=564305 RepID=A0ABZ1CWZ9_9TREE|nr:hypothetical protein IL334_002634 [Kwoniella shivajii]
MPSLHQTCKTCGLPRASPPPILDTMFEEDFERCFICQQACKGLYCSSECRLRDQGTPSPAVRALHGPVKITSQLPAALSPLIRPTQLIGRSPRTLPQKRATSSMSSGSSVSSSPLQSPQTNPSEVDSPKRDTFDLPPPAYPSKQFSTLPASVPMKIPALAPRASPLVAPTPTPGSQGSTVYPVGASIDTLRFGRKPSAVNSVLSPNALIPRCACGKPVNHKGRASSKERAEFDSGFSRLSLGPSEITPQPQEPRSRSARIVSESALPPFTGKIQPNGFGTPTRTPLPLGIPPSPQDIASTSLLSRSRSDPIPHSPKTQRRAIPPAPPVITNVITPSHREQHGMPSSPIVPAQSSTTRPGRRMNALDVVIDSPRRGRSRDRQDHHVGQMTSNLGGPADREQAPSRSRHRRDSRKRSDSRERGRGSKERDQDRSGQRSPRSPIGGNVVNQTQTIPAIMPSWSRRASEATADRRKAMGDVISPIIMRRTTSGEKKSSGYERDQEERQRKKAELERATQQLGQIFTVAGGQKIRVDK